jgi:hypothetical protein
MNANYICRAAGAFLLAGMLLALSQACKTTTVPSGETRYIRSSNQGDLIEVQARGYGRNEREAIADAEKKALETLLFTGLTGSPQQYPLVNDPKARQTHSAYFNKLIEGGEYRSYLTTSNPMASKAEKDKRTGQKTILVTLEINVFALRRELEQSIVTRKFGF